MENTDKGDRIRIDIPDETDPNHQYHGEHGVVVKTLSDDAAEDARAQIKQKSLDSLTSHQQAVYGIICGQSLCGRVLSTTATRTSSTVPGANLTFRRHSEIG